jgi:hypothetical protein
MAQVRTVRSSVHWLAVIGRVVSQEQSANAYQESWPKP